MELTTRNGYTYWIDDEDYDRISPYQWHGMVFRNSLVSGGTGTSYKHIGTTIYNPATRKQSSTILLHRFIMNAPKGLEVDHIDGDCLNNRKENLRLCTKSQNIMNRSKTCRNTSGFKGVSWHKHRRKWEAQIQVGGTKIYIGIFNTPEEAAAYYNRAAAKLFGEYAKLNLVKAAV